MRNIQIRFVLATLLLTVLSQGILAKGPPHKVEVTAANPSEAAQGQELEVTVSGSGFDAGSQVGYLVTGTNDDSQVDVLSVEYVSDTELRTRIRPKDNALTTDYDIEVRTSSGRKGKGTTLFRVKQSETACTGFEPKEPEIAYLSGIYLSEGLELQDIYASSGTGCDQYLLLEAAALAVPDDGDPKNGFGEELASVNNLRLDVEGNEGVVIWRNTVVRPISLLALQFGIDADGQVAVDAAGPRLAYLPPDDYSAYAADVRFNDSGEVEVIAVEYAPDQSEWRLVHVNIDSGSRTQLTAGNCPFQDAGSQCYRPAYANVWWNDNGTEVFLNPYNWPETEQNYLALARIARIAGVWQSAEILMKHDAQIDVIGIRPDGLLAYEWFHVVARKNGRTSFKDTYFVAATVDPDDCALFECVPEDGQELAVDTEMYPRGWTRSGGMLFVEVGTEAQRNIREYRNPFTGEVGSLIIEDVDRHERDTSY